MFGHTILWDMDPLCFEAQMGLNCAIDFRHPRGLAKPDCQPPRHGELHQCLKRSGVNHIVPVILHLAREVPKMLLWQRAGLWQVGLCVLLLAKSRTPMSCDRIAITY